MTRRRRLAGGGYPRPMRVALLAIGTLALALALSACAGSQSDEGTDATVASPAPAAQAPTASDPAPPAGESAPEPAPSNDGREAEPPARSDASSPPDAAELENVVRTWSEALNAGDNETAADLFAEGAVVIQGGSALQLATREAAIIFNRSLPCSGAIVDFSFVDNAIVATFELGDRPQGGCDAEPGTLAAAVFVIEDGLIQLWQQIPVPGTDPFPPSDADRTVT